MTAIRIFKVDGWPKVDENRTFPLTFKHITILGPLPFNRAARQNKLPANHDLPRTRARAQAWMMMSFLLLSALHLNSCYMRNKSQRVCERSLSIHPSIHLSILHWTLRCSGWVIQRNLRPCLFFFFFWVLLCSRVSVIPTYCPTNLISPTYSPVSVWCVGWSSSALSLDTYLRTLYEQNRCGLCFYMHLFACIFFIV